MDTVTDNYEDNQEFIKAFNEGFLIAMYEKQVAEILFENIGVSSPYAEGIVAGIEEGEKERLNLEHLDELGLLNDPQADYDLDR